MIYYSLNEPRLHLSPLTLELAERYYKQRRHEWLMEELRHN